ncbi:hypothetical protein HZS_8122 [Henneguya salminicola]|nr:hypothetical protein HZS_8122 [Henneguya salminicola]
MQTHKVSTQTDPLTKVHTLPKYIEDSIFKDPIISFIEHSKPTEQNGAESSESAPQLNTKTAPKLVHIEYVSEFESGDIYEYDSSQSSSLDASIIIAEENNQNNSNPIGPEILNNIVHLKKYIHQSIDTLNIKLCNHITEEIDTLQQPFDKRTSYLTKQLADIG